MTVRHILSHTSGLTGSSELQQVTGADSTPLKARALSSVTGPLQWAARDLFLKTATQVFQKIAP